MSYLAPGIYWFFDSGIQSSCSCCFCCGVGTRVGYEKMVPRTLSYVDEKRVVNYGGGVGVLVISAD